MKHIPIYMLSISIFLNSMDAPKHAINNQLPFDQWEFFSESNCLDKMGPAIPFWDSKKEQSGTTVAHLHILEHTDFSQKKSILDTECSKGHTSYFLAQNADQVIARSHNTENMEYALSTFRHPNLNFSNYFDLNRYDLIVSCYPIANKELLTKLKCLLNPQGEILCVFNTQSNTKPIVLQAFENMDNLLQKRFPFYQYNLMCATFKEMFPRPADDLLRKMIAQSNLEILSYTPKNFDLLIMKKQHKKFLAACRAIFMKLPTHTHISTQKMNKSADTFIGNIVKIIKKDNSGNWFYPFDLTVVRIKNSN